MDALFDLKKADKKSFFLISGPCVIESEKLIMEVAERLVEITGDLGITYDMT